MMGDRLAALEARMRKVEDELAVIRLVASYGPMVDSGLPEPAARLFAEGGVYDVDLGKLDSPQAFSAMLAGPEHQGVVAQGIAHVMGLPQVMVDGDRARAVNPTFLFLREGDGYKVWRVAQNVWNLARIDGAWKIVHRTNRAVGNGDAARALLESAVGG